jgi:hypothetical protein
VCHASKFGGPGNNTIRRSEHFIAETILSQEEFDRLSVFALTGMYIEDPADLEEHAERLLMQEDIARRSHSTSR